MKHREQRRPNWRKLPPKRLISKFGVVDLVALDPRLKLEPSFDPNGRIYSINLSKVATIMPNPSSVESKPLGNGLYQHTFTWEAS